MTCRTAKPKPNRYRLPDAEGLYLDIMPQGTKFWRIKFRIHGTQKLITLGKYPNLSLLKAREEKTKILALVRNGIDPILERINQKIDAKVKANLTFKKIAIEWHEINKPQWQPRYAATILHRLEKYAFPDLGDISITLIRSSNVLDCLKKIDVHAPEMARRVKQLISHVFLYAMSTDRAEKDVTASLRHALRKYKKSRYHSLDLSILPKFLFDVYENKVKLHRQTYLALKFMMLTFVRTQEMMWAKWTEFDFDNALWIIPAERMKMKQPHIVPLSRQSLEILNELRLLNGRREHVFPSIYRPMIPMCKGTVLVAVKRLGYSGLMTGHGFRALALGVLKEKLKYSHEVADRQLAHAPRSSVDRAYDRAKFLDDRIVMMQKYADYLDETLAKERLKHSPELIEVSKAQPVPLQTANFLFHQPQQMNISVGYKLSA
ncbi:tyrosine-type recombinase/integrase [Nubsella zeaxanthinifaciens]|uniref:tyrosine-type recombinase/integrase n=1 Tax=Nubsella zeaxanthinifaciens TaxID=392412 RepID=UPI003D0192E6